MNLTRAERNLYFSIWAMILVVAAFWKFHSGRELAQNPDSIVVSVAPELRPWFSAGGVTDVSAHGYTVQLELRPEYRRSLKGGGSDLRVGYRLKNPDAPPQQGAVLFRLLKERGTAEASLPSPERRPASEIELFLQW